MPQGGDVFPTPQLLAVARGDAPADVCLRGGRVVNVFSGEVEAGDVLIHGGQVAAVRVGGAAAGAGATETIDVAGAFVVPGFIDAHMHIESTMMPPREFARVAAPHGTLGVVADPHEIANVLGVAGIRAMMDDAAGAPMEIMFAVSSCVPASPLETSGAELNAADLAPLFDDERVVALAEMMNFPGVIAGVPEVLEKVRLGLARRIVDGHAPGVRGAGLDAYAAAGISSDHECTTAEEAAAKLRVGMRVFIREGSAARNLEALLPLVNAANRHRFCFCTDDRHPEDLYEQGHIDHVVRSAIARALDPVWAIAMGSLHAAEHYRRPDLGAIAPGRWANLFVCDDLHEVRARMVMHRGRVVARDGEMVLPRGGTSVFPASGVRLPAGLSEASFRVAAPRDVRAKLRVIRVLLGQIVTAMDIETPRVEGGACVADVAAGRDVLKFAVIERHRGTGNIGLGFVRGLGLRAGAIASTVGHDSHNLSVVGANDADMLLAARTLERCGGGQCVVRGGQVLAVLPLPIAGLMSDQPASEVIRQQRALLAAAASIGCAMHDPFMPLSFLSLPVIPALKLTDRGLVDVAKFAHVGLFE